MTHDDATWRAAAASCPGYATYPDTPPGDPSWWRRTGTAPWRPAAFTTTDPGPLDDPATTPPARRVPTDPFRAPETPADAAPTPTPAPRPASAATDTPPAPPPPSAPLPEHTAAPGEALPPLPDSAYPPGAAALPPPAEPASPGPQTVGRRQLDPGSPWRWIRQFL
ncbi:hypothetical protein [Micromonospora aurantiaca (nom. illeg.)]|uniref:hypothetical protein n=1 Tax=Micromonospora aurantiaca (nom. illeg.) TaxID=47850 RepID=UPI00119F2D31